LEEELSTMQPPTNVVTLHPGAMKRYLEIVDDLATSLPRRAVFGDEELAAALRELISCVTVTPAQKGRPIIDVTGRLSVLTGADLFPTSRGDSIGSGGGIPAISPRRIPREMAYLFDVA
jgi:hypothetical protein